MSPSGKTTILIVSAPGIWEVSIRSVLAALPDVELLDTAQGSLTAYQMVRDLRPHLLIVDDSLSIKEGLLLVTRIKAEGSPPYCIVVVPTARQEKMALAAGADAVILRSASSEKLAATVHAAREQRAASNAAENDSTAE